MREAKEWVGEQLTDVLQHDAKEYEIQDMYNRIESVLQSVGQQFGKEKEKECTDDKITVETKKLIEKREEMRQIQVMNSKQKIELAEVQKLVRREIRKDSRDYEERKVKEIIEENWSIR